MQPKRTAPGTRPGAKGTTGGHAGDAAHELEVRVVVVVAAAVPGVDDGAIRVFTVPERGVDDGGGGAGGTQKKYMAYETDQLGRA